MEQWSEEKKNMHRLIFDKINQIVSIRNKLAGVEAMGGKDELFFPAEIRAKSNQIRQDLFRESVVLVDLQRIFQFIDK